MVDIEEKSEKIWNQTGDQKRGRGEGRGTEGERGTGALSGGQRRSLLFLPEVLSRQLLCRSDGVQLTPVSDGVILGGL